MSQMSKIIKITPQNLEELRRDFETALRDVKLSDGRISFTKTFSVIQRKATLYFTELAYLKMLMLVREFDKEVAWHGIAKRGDDPEKDEYIISDILVYPQEVTGSTVNTDQEKYQMWLMNHDDEVFNNIRMQGHSHVNMGTTPSSVDNSLYERILDQLDDDMFYIFLIWNKRGEKTIKIYDLAKNVLFETADVSIAFVDDGTGIEQFMKNAKEMVTTKSYVTPATTTGGNGNVYTNYYSGYPSRTYGNTATTSYPTEAGAVAGKPDNNASTAQPNTKKKKKKKKRAAQQPYVGYGYDSYDDDDDVYGGRYADCYY